MALQVDEKQDPGANVEIIAGRFVVETSVKEKKLQITLRDKISKKVFRSSFATPNLRNCGFSESQAAKLESIGQFIDSAHAGQGNLKLIIKIPQSFNNQQLQPHDGMMASDHAQLIITKSDNFFGDVNYTVELEELQRDNADINSDAIDDVKDDVNYMRQQLETVSADISIAAQHRLPKGSIIEWYGSKNNVPKFWKIYEADDGDDAKDDDEGGAGAKDIYTYESDFDKNGIIYALGSVYGTKEWRNPATTRIVEIRAAARMGRISEPKEFLIGREPGIDCYVSDCEYSWFLINFKDILIRPTNYTLRHDAGETNQNHLRNWQLQGTNDGDGDNWDILTNHKGDESLNKPDGTCTWSIPDSVTGFYQYIRIIMTAPTSTGGWYICCSGFEIYGEVKSIDCDNGAPKKKHTIIKIV